MMIVGCWNTAWRGTASWQAEEMRGRMMQERTELVCFAETQHDFLSSDWHGIFSQADYGYRQIAGRRKVSLWSRTPWQAIDEIGDPSLPSGRFVQGLTVTSCGLVRVIGVCIPWPAAHVSSGRKDRARWEDHGIYIAGLSTALSNVADDLPTILLGDFNQCVPRRHAPKNLYNALMLALAHYHVWTAGDVAGLSDRQPVCHIAGSSHFRLIRAFGYNRTNANGTVSDHDGLAVEVALV